MAQKCRFSQAPFLVRSTATAATAVAATDATHQQHQQQQLREVAGVGAAKAPPPQLVLHLGSGVFPGSHSRISHRIIGCDLKCCCYIYQDKLRTAATGRIESR